jgi:hypothetical protein
VKLHEAVALRDAGIRKPVLLMGPVAETDFPEVARRDITLMVYTPVAQGLERAAGKIGRRSPCTCAWTRGWDVWACLTNAQSISFAGSPPLEAFASPE